MRFFWEQARKWDRETETREHVKKSLTRTFQAPPRRPQASANLDDGSHPCPFLQDARGNSRQTRAHRSSALAQDGREAPARAVAFLPRYRRRSVAMAWCYGANAMMVWLAKKIMRRERREKWEKELWPWEKNKKCWLCVFCLSLL